MKTKNELVIKLLYSKCSSKRRYYGNGKCFVTDLVGAYSVTSNKVKFEYVYYYLKFNEDFIKNNYVMSTGAPSINLRNFIDKFEIPIPSLQVQKVIVERLDLLSENNKTMEKRILNN